MLALDQRRLFLEAIKPPAGYSFDLGIGTTYTLDLTALLVAPLSLALMDHTEDPETLADPLLLLESLRKFSDRLTVFCQASRISIPKKYNHLYQYLENKVVEVQAPEGGVFHPKVWLLRYSADDYPVLYRLLVMTRNLTFDKSWDLMVQLDGDLVDRQVGYSRNNPLGDFVQALPGLAINPVTQHAQAAIDLLQDEVRRVKFNPPYPFSEEYQFHPLGIEGYRRGFLLKRPYHRVLVVSPFLQDDILKRIGSQGESHVLISETEALDGVKPETLRPYSQVFNLDSSIWDEELEDPEAEETLSSPSGLHAKLFVLHHGWDSTWLVGSANATRPGLSGLNRRNVEFMLELTGKRSRVGIDKVLGDAENDMSIRNLLHSYQQPEEKAAVDQDAMDAEHLSDQVRKWLVAVKCVLEVNSVKEDAFKVTIKATDPTPAPAGKYSIQCWPTSMPDTHRRKFALDTTAIEFPGMTILALTPFIAFTIRTSVGEARHTTRFVLQLPVFGMPPEREDHLIRAVISDKAQFLRFLRLILSQDPSELWRNPDWLTESGVSTNGDGSVESDLPLLEELLRALSRSPEKIDRINQIVERLTATTEGKEVLPEGFESLWTLFVKATRERQ